MPVPEPKSSEPAQVDVESEAEAVQSDVADGMVGKAEDASNDGDEHSEQAEVARISQDLNHKGHEGLKGTTCYLVSVKDFSGTRCYLRTRRIHTEILYL